MERRIFRVLIILVGVLIQTSFLAVAFPPYVYPNLILVIVITWTIIAGFERIWPWIVGMGIFWDLVSFSIVGVSVIKLILASYLVSFLTKRFILERKSSGLLIATIFVVISTFLYNIFNIFFLEIFKSGEGFLSGINFLDFSKSLIIQSAFNVPLFGVVYILLSKANKYFSFYDNRVRIKNK